MSSMRSWLGHRGSLAEPELRSLAETVARLLSEKFPGAVRFNDSLGGSSLADVVFQQGNRLAVVEFKTGDPDLPLPSSTARQMAVLTDEAKRFSPESEVVPIVVTNYRVADPDRAVLEREGVRIVSIPSPLKLDAVVSDVIGTMEAA